MGRHIQLATHLSIADLEQRYRASCEPHERSWWQILWLLARGYTRAWIGQIAKRYNEQGPEGMVNRQRTTSWRAPRMLSTALKRRPQPHCPVSRLTRAMIPSS